MINSHAIQSQIISKSTSKTQPEPPIRCIYRGGWPPLRASPRLVFPSKGGPIPRTTLPLVAMGTKPQGGKPQRATLRGCFPSNPSPDGPPNLGIARICSGVLPGRCSTGFSPIYMDFLGRLFLVSSGVCIHSWLLVHMHVFFSGIVLWRNYLINRVELFEEKSILVLPECLEAC